MEFSSKTVGSRIVLEYVTNCVKPGAVERDQRVLSRFTSSRIRNGDVGAFEQFGEMSFGIDWSS